MRSSPEKKARLQLRWWHWLLLVFIFLLLLVVTVVLSLRTYGEQRYAQVLAELKSQGKATTVDEVIAAAPAIDEDVQGRWSRWAAVAPNYPPSEVYADWPRFVSGAGPVPAAVLSEGDLHRATMESALQLLRDGNVAFGVTGSLRGIPPAGARTFLDVSRQSSDDFLAVRSLATWLRHQACLSGDPTIALSNLERLLRSGETPGVLFDALSVIAVAETRDQTYLDLALLGRLPSSLRTPWLTESPRHQEWLARGFDGERALLNDALAESMRSRSWFTVAFTTDPFETGFTEPWNPTHVFGGTWMWCTTVHDCALMAETEAHIAARLRRERTDPIPQDGVNRMWFVIGKISLPNLLMSASYGVNQIVGHRLNRLSVMLLEPSADGLPRDEQDLIARFGQVLDLGGDHLRLRYEHLADDRFRLVVDPTTPVPNFVDASMVPGWSHDFGRPAAADRLVIKRGSIELQVPAVVRLPATTP